MKKLIIIIAVFTWSCSSDPSEEIIPVKDWTLNNGTWNNSNIYFDVDGKRVYNIEWPEGSGSTNRPTYAFRGDSLQLILASYDRNNAYTGAFEIMLYWDLGKDEQIGYMRLYDHPQKYEIQNEITFLKK